MFKTIGIFAHVDGGKTTFSEQLLYKNGSIRNLGRVDNQTAFLDCDNIEKEREELKKMLGWPYTEVARINRFLYQWNFQRENKKNIKRFEYFCTEKLPIYFK